MEKETPKDIGKRIQAVRKSLRLLQKDFSRELGLSRSGLCNIEKGHIIPRFDLLYELSTRFKVDPYYLLHGKGEMFQTERAEKDREILDLIFQSESTDWLKRFLYYFKLSPVVRYSMMSYFAETLLSRKKLIEQDIEQAALKNIAD